MEHYAGGGFAILLEKAFQNVDDELHRRIVVVEDQNAVEARLLGPGLGSRDDSRASTGAVAPIFAVLHARHEFCRGIPAVLHQYLAFRGFLTRLSNVGSLIAILSPSFLLTIWTTA
jgi:hypothetical protein